MPLAPTNHIITNMKLTELLNESTYLDIMDFRIPSTWHSKSTEELIDIYNVALEDEKAGSPEFQGRFKQLHDLLAKRLGSREAATLQISKRRSGGSHKKADIPPGIKVEPEDAKMCLMWEDNKGMWKGTYGGYSGEGSNYHEWPARDLNEEDWASWEEDSKEYLPRIKKSIDFLHIPYEKEARRGGSYHEAFWYMAVRVSIEDAQRINNFILSGNLDDEEENY